MKKGACSTALHSLACNFSFWPHTCVSGAVGPWPSAEAKRTIRGSRKQQSHIMQALRASPSSSVAQSGTTFRAVPQLLGPCVARSRVRLSSGASPCHAAPCARASKSLRAQAVSQQLGPADVESSPAAAPLVHAAERSRAARTEKAGYSDCIMIQGAIVRPGVADSACAWSPS